MNNDILKWALEYPYDIVGESCLVRNGALEQLGAISCSEIIDDFISRYLPKEKMRSFPAPMQQMAPILAYGASASRTRLIREFGAAGGNILILKATLFDFDVVYSAHLAPCGAIPATLERAPGLETLVSVLFLEPEMLLKLHEAERAGTEYDFIHLWNIRLQIEAWPLYFDAYTYISCSGPILLDGKPVGLKSSVTRGLRGASMDERQILSWFYEEMKGRTPSEKELKDFVFEHANTMGEAIRAERNRIMNKYAGTFDFQNYEITPMNNCEKGRDSTNIRP